MFFLEIILKRKGCYKKFTNLYDRPAEPNYNVNEKRYIANRETYEKMLKIRRTGKLKKTTIIILAILFVIKDWSPTCQNGLWEC